MNHMEEEIIVKHLTPLIEKWGYPSPYIIGREVYKKAGIYNNEEIKPAHNKIFMKEWVWMVSLSLYSCVAFLVG